MVTSTDVGFDPIEIRTGITANKVAAADYSAYNTAVEKANALEREYYKDLTVLDAALAVDVSGLKVSEQAIVDAQTKAIEDALAALALKDADYTAYNAVVEKAKALNRDLYENLTALDEALAVDVSGKNITEQEEVDAQTQAILTAIENLVEKPVTEPETPEEPSQPVTEAPSETEATTQSEAKPSTDAKSPQTGANTVSIFGLSFICICSAAVLVFTSRKESNKSDA